MDGTESGKAGQNSRETVYNTPMGLFYPERNDRATRCKGKECPSGGRIPGGETSVMVVRDGKYVERKRYCLPCGLKGLAADAAQAADAVRRLAEAEGARISAP